MKPGTGSVMRAVQAIAELRDLLQAAHWTARDLDAEMSHCSNAAGDVCSTIHHLRQVVERLRVEALSSSERRAASASRDYGMREAA